MSRRDALTMAGFALLLLLGPIGLFWAIGEGLPHYVGGKGDPNDVSGEWISKGTLLSAPLVPLIAFAVALTLARLRGAWGTVGAVLTILITLVFIAASIGEPFVPEEMDGPGFLLVIFRIVAYGCTAAVLLCAGRLLAERRRAAGPGVATA